MKKPMKCKYCHAKGIKISHFMRAHKKLMLAKMRRGRGKGRSRAGKRSSGRRGASYTHGTGGYSKLTVTLHN